MDFRPAEIRALWWLGKTLRLDEDYDLAGLVTFVRHYGSRRLYQRRVIQDLTGKSRVLYEPSPYLKVVQRRIDRNILSQMVRDPNTFGFLGGSARQVAERHRGLSTLKLDIRDAFFQIGHQEVLDCLHWHLPSVDCLSWYVSRFIADLCTLTISPETDRSFFPQGAPTSPKLFHLCLWRLDQKLGRLADRVGGVYSRFADNVFFSVPASEFPSRVKVAVFCHIREKAGLPVHKVRVVYQGQICRILGYNVAGAVVVNTRAFKRQLRKALSHWRYVLNHGLPSADAEAKAMGMMGFAIRETLSPQPLEQFERCRERVSC